MAKLLYDHGMKDTALVLLGHGSSKHPSSSIPCRLHADAIRRMGIFKSVHCGFLKETPLIEECLDYVDAEDVFILPFFLAEGYYTKKVIPEKLRLSERPASMRYLKPVGIDAMTRDVILDQAARAMVMGEWRQEETSLVLLGHGSTKSATSKDTLLEHIEALKELTNFAQITDLWLEEPPFIKDWRDEVTEKNILCIPYLIADGQHGGWDIPELLGMQRDIYDVYKAHEVESYKMKLTAAIGKSQMMTELIKKVIKLNA